MTETTTTERTWRQLTQADFAAIAIDRFGPDPLDWAYTCPNCGDVATAREFPPGKRHSAGVECIGAHIAAARGCTWTAYDQPNPGPWTVQLPDGQLARCFALADAPSQAPMTARLMGPADVERGVVGKCRACGTPVSVHGHDGPAVGYVTDQGLMCGQHCDAGPKPSQPPQSASPDSSGTPGGAAAENAPAAPCAPARSLSVERGSDPEHISRPGGEFQFNVEHWTYRVALTPGHSILGYQDIDGVALCVIFADAELLPFGAFLPLPEQLPTVLDHIAKHGLPITGAEIAEAMLLIDDAAHLDAPTRPQFWNRADDTATADTAPIEIPTPSSEFLAAHVDPDRPFVHDA